MNERPLELIVATARGGVIGDSTRQTKFGLPWHIPEDLAHFKSVTMGRTMIVGRKTFEAIGKPLKGRRTLVVSRTLQDAALSAKRVSSKTVSAKIVSAVSSLEAALAHPWAAHGASDSAEAKPYSNAPIVIGGSEIYALALPFVTKIYLTLIDREVDGDTFFPGFEALEQDFRIVHERAAKSEPDVIFRELSRRPEVQD